MKGVLVRPKPGEVMPVVRRDVHGVRVSPQGRGRFSRARPVQARCTDGP
jgi:hypothetical protein